MDETGEPLEKLLQSSEQGSSQMATDRDKLIRLRDAIAKGADDFDQSVQPIVGRCSCGGQFGLHAPVRCPVCKSSNIEQGETLMNYD
jgi:predicted Zn-ribbon and HTH transcriptional regulator